MARFFCHGELWPLFIKNLNQIVSFVNCMISRISSVLVDNKAVMSGTDLVLSVAFFSLCSCIKCKGPAVLSTDFTKRNNFIDSQFASLDYKIIVRRSQLLKEKVCSSELIFKMRPFLGREANTKITVVPLKV